MEGQSREVLGGIFCSNSLPFVKEEGGPQFAGKVPSSSLQLLAEPTQSTRSGNSQLLFFAPDYSVSLGFIAVYSPLELHTTSDIKILPSEFFNPVPNDFFFSANRCCR